MQKYTEALTLCPDWSGIAVMLRIQPVIQLMQGYSHAMHMA